MDLVSIIIPVYNGEATIQETLDSVFAQTWQNLEILVIDDGSTDATIEIVERCDDPRLALHRFPNGGAQIARNRGIALTSGSLVSFLDADDWWHPEKVARQVEALDALEGAGVVYSFIRYVDEDGEVLHRGYTEPHQGDVLEPLFVRFFLQTGSNALVRRSVIEAVGGFDEALEVCDDYDFYLRAAEHVPFAVVPHRHVHYRLHDGSLSSGAERMRTHAHLVLHRAVARQPERLAPLLLEAMAVNDGYVFGKAIAGPRNWRTLLLCARCLATHLRAGRVGLRLLAARFDKLGYWLERIVTWLFVPERWRKRRRREAAATESGKK